MSVFILRLQRAILLLTGETTRRVFCGYLRLLIFNAYKGKKERKEDYEVKTLGRHILTEFYGCDYDTLNNVEIIQKHMEEATKIAGATIVQSVFHLFNPHGVSGVVVIAESHLAIHTWPEYGYAAIDLFTCGEVVDPWKAYAYLRERFHAQHVSSIEMKRGQLDFIEKDIPQNLQPSPHISAGQQVNPNLVIPTN